jgi:NifU-like protein
VSFYPQKINERFQNPRNGGKPENPNAVGAGASFVCGSFVRFYLRINPETKEISEAGYKTNGCGFAIAAAEILAESIVGEKLTGLHGLDTEALRAEIERKLGQFANERTQCAEICFDALHRAFSDYRARQIEEFAGEKALICTCFSVSEETIETAIDRNQIETVEEVAKVCRAGGGCGSCRFLIQEMIDIYRSERF